MHIFPWCIIPSLVGEGLGVRLQKKKNTVPSIGTFLPTQVLAPQWHVYFATAAFGTYGIGLGQAVLEKVARHYGYINQ